MWKISKFFVLGLFIAVLTTGCAHHHPGITYLPQNTDLNQIIKDKNKRALVRKIIDEKAEQKARQIAAQKLKEIETKHNLAVLELERRRNTVFKKILKTSPTPLKVPDTILRVLILPYVDASGNLHQYTYIYTKVDEGKWILGDYLLSPIKINFKNDLNESSHKIVHPLKADKKGGVRKHGHR